METKNFEGKFIADQKIKEVKDIESKTYLGSDRVEVLFEDETKEEFPKNILEAIISDEQSDLTTLRDKRVNPVLVQVIALMAEAELNLDDQNYFTSRLPSLLQMNFDKAVDKLFGKPQYKTTLRDIENIIKV
jgi:hypothetical protein